MRNLDIDTIEAVGRNLPADLSFRFDPYCYFCQESLINLNKMKWEGAEKTKEWKDMYTFVITPDTGGRYWHIETVEEYKKGGGGK